MSESLNVIALVSGGKDSFMSILHCMLNSHRIVALANISPMDREGLIDINSYMYQIIGHSILPLYGKALGITIYRTPTTGTALNTNKDYEPGAISDETETLFYLLSGVMINHPEANAVCSGAIESTYQRTRVESVAMRLGLIPLSYLWQYPSLPAPVPMKGGLLKDLVAVGLDARIVKVASGGLDDTFLWESLLDERVQKRLAARMAKFGGSVLGEGGEYETIVINGPAGVWNARLEIGEDMRDNYTREAGESCVHIKGGHLIDKEDDQGMDRWKDKLNPPQLFDAAFKTMVNMQDQVVPPTKYRTTLISKRVHMHVGWKPKRGLIRSMLILSINNLNAVNAWSSTKEQITTIKSNLVTLLEEHKRSTDDIVFAIIILRSIADFAAVNDVYKTMFLMSNPPARVTVACGDRLPKGINVMLSVSLDFGPRQDRAGLHVQSRSYWAPANIGPYSQAITVPFRTEGDEASMIFIAGQVPLEPASMQRFPDYNLEYHPRIFWAQTCLALQHLWRVSKSVRVTWWVYGIAFFVGNTDDDARRRAMLTWNAWERVHDPGLWQTEGEGEVQEAPDFDIWNNRHGGNTTYAAEVEEQYLPDFGKRQPPQDSDQADCQNAELPAFFAVQVDELPRGCNIEWYSLGLAKAKVTLTTITCHRIIYHHCYLPEHYRTFTAISFPSLLSDHEFALRFRLLGLGKVAWVMHAHVTIYTTRTLETDALTIPCRSIWGRDGIHLQVAAIIYHRGTPEGMREAKSEAINEAKAERARKVKSEQLKEATRPEAPARTQSS